MKKILFYSFLFVLFLIPSKAFALNEVNVYFFHSDTCNICEQEKIYLQALKQDRYPNMRIHYYETSNPDNFKLMEEAKQLYGITQNGVPFTVIADTPYTGFSQGIKGEFQRTVYLASKTKYENKLGQKLGITYSTDLEGEVKEYKENSDYKIEETSGNSHKTPKKDTSTFKKYKASIILISVGAVLLIIFIVLSIIDFRKGNRI